MCAVRSMPHPSRALCRRLVGSYAEPSLWAELPRRRLDVEADGELLGYVGRPRAGRPGGEVVLVKSIHPDHLRLPTYDL